ncbi:TRAP transporter small permease [Nitratireductor sp. ZSWI3]|uniref:TRAP transporter small permease n=1 Tax=Nitratireductor sp. ZSWI3 TaxID=2966359 RepID=UPI0021503152|nr:TRAP transporter small permease [Nitratireductor sp. ZSWI3]MCR4269140.1 TRAP transporter small permease [Nitratireductor sp. ZSWI3]
MSFSGRYSLEGCVASVLFIVLFAVLMIQIFGRTPLFTGPVWTEEAARWIWVWMALVGIAEVERTNGQLRMGFVADTLPVRWRRTLFLVIDAVYLGIVAHLVWISYKTVLRTWNNEAVSLPATDAVLYASGLVATVLILHRIARRVLSFVRSDTPEEAR